jgi:hypothetical protein
MSDEDEDLPTADDADQPFDAGDPAQVKRRETAQQIRKREVARFWNSVFASPVGRQEMWLLITEGKPFETPFAVGPNGFPQPEATWWKAGQAEFSLRIYRSWLVAHPDAIRLMHLENDPAFMPAPKAKRKRGESE